jgi:hypothetical protein
MNIRFLTRSVLSRFSQKQPGKIFNWGGKQQDGVQAKKNVQQPQEEKSSK